MSNSQRHLILLIILLVNISFSQIDVVSSCSECTIPHSEPAYAYLWSCSAPRPGDIAWIPGRSDPTSFKHCISYTRSTHSPRTYLWWTNNHNSFTDSVCIPHTKHPIIGQNMNFQHHLAWKYPEITDKSIIDLRWSSHRLDLIMGDLREILVSYWFGRGNFDVPLAI